MLTTTDEDGSLRSRPMAYKQGDTDSKAELWLVSFFLFYSNLLLKNSGSSHDQIHQKYLKSRDILKSMYHLVIHPINHMSVSVVMLKLLKIKPKLKNYGMHI
jgi:hypothetical protein